MLFLTFFRCKSPCETDWLFPGSPVRATLEATSRAGCGGESGGSVPGAVRPVQLARLIVGITTYSHDFTWFFVWVSILFRCFVWVSMLFLQFHSSGRDFASKRFEQHRNSWEGLILTLKGQLKWTWDKQGQKPNFRCFVLILPVDALASRIAIWNRFRFSGAAKYHVRLVKTIWLYHTSNINHQIISQILSS